MAFQHAFISGVWSDAFSFACRRSISFRLSRQASMRVAKWNTQKAIQRLSDLAAFQHKHARLFEGRWAWSSCLSRTLHAPLDTAMCPGLRVEEFLEQAELGLNSYLPTKNSRGELVLLLHAEKLSVFAQVLTRATRRMHLCGTPIREHGAPVRKMTRAWSHRWLGTGCRSPAYFVVLARGGSV